MPTVSCLETLYKRNQATNEDKVYVAAVVQLDGGAGWNLVLKWGRRGTKGSPAKPYRFTTFEAARTRWKQKVDEQLGDGYKQIDWQDGTYGLRGYVQSLGSLEGLSGSNAPAAVTQKPAASPKPSALSDKIWELSQQTKSTFTIAKELGITRTGVDAVLNIRLQPEKLAWQGRGMPPHHAIVGHGLADANGVSICALCTMALNSLQHIEYLKVTQHKFIERTGFDTCWCGKEQKSVLHVQIKFQKTAIVAPTPATPDPVVEMAKTMTNDPEGAAGVPAPNLESEPHMPPRAPIVLPNRRRERAPRG
jgi:predicted DNA-binding WGR domain protein